MNSTIELVVKNKEIHTIKRDNLTTGQQLNTVKIKLEGKVWEDLRKLVFFKVEKEVVFTDFGEESATNKQMTLEVEVPAKLCSLAYLGKVVYIGVRGAISDNENAIVYPTPYFRLGVMELGAGPDGTADTKPGLQPYDEAVKKAEAARDAAIEAQGEAEAARNSAIEAQEKAEQAKTNAENAVSKIEELAEAAKDSADTAKSHEESAKNYAEAASASATSANKSAAAASESKSSAAGSAVAASKSEKNAATSATKAETQANNAANSAASAENSATTATNKATAAANSATSAENSATAASNSAATAGTAATQAEAARDQYPQIDKETHFWKVYNPETGEYGLTEVLAQFCIRKVFTSIEEMNEHYSDSDIHVGDFVAISSNAEDEDNAKIYVKGSSEFTFITDLSGIQGPQGVSVTSIELTSGTHAPGTTDTYTITLSNGSTSTFSVYNGKDGNGVGDMKTETYDPQGKNTDIFAYVESLDLTGADVEDIWNNT